MAEENDHIPNIPLESETPASAEGQLQQPPAGISIPSSRPAPANPISQNLTQPIKPPMIPPVPGSKTASTPFTFSKAKIPTPPGIKPRVQDSLARPIVPVQVDENSPLGGSNADPFMTQPTSHSPLTGISVSNDLPPTTVPIVEHEYVPVVNPLSSLGSQHNANEEKIELPILKPEPKAVVRRTTINIDQHFKVEPVATVQPEVQHSSSDGAALAWIAAAVSFAACAYMLLLYFKQI